jgi:hypothetical protein
VYQSRALEIPSYVLSASIDIVYCYKFIAQNVVNMAMCIDQMYRLEIIGSAINVEFPDFRRITASWIYDDALILHYYHKGYMYFHKKG